MGVQDVLKLLGKKINLLNCGGCGIAALAAIRWAEKNHNPVSGIEIIFLYTEDEESICEENQSLIENGHIDSALVPAHIAIGYCGRVLDSEGVVDIGSYIYHSDVLPQELLTLINRGTWNPSFSRLVEVPKIERLLNIDLSDIDIILNTI